MSDLDRPLANTHQVIDLEKRSDALLGSMTDLFEQGQKPHHDAFPDHFGPAKDRAAIGHYLQGFLKPRNPLRQRNGFAKGWYAGGELAGYLLYRLSKSANIFYGEPRWTCFVEDIVVSENARGAGGASALMGALMEEITPLENCAVSGTVWNMNAASEALFRKHGFEPLSKAFYKVSP
ncbi:MAG: GNAT family N-acetyltransferase [Erythrobacter sp.]